MVAIYSMDECREDEIPEHLKKVLLDALNERKMAAGNVRADLTKFSVVDDFLASTASVAAVEMGFRTGGMPCTEGFDVRALRCLTGETLLRARDPSRGAYRLDFWLPRLELYKFPMLLIPVGDYIVLNFLTLKSGSVVESDAMVLVPSKCLHISREQLPLQFQSLSDLSAVLKNFFNRQKLLALSSNGLPHPSLLGIPEEIMMKIFNFLSPKDFLKITSSSSAMRCYLRRDNYWRIRLWRDFAVRWNENAFDKYISVYKSSKKRIPDMRSRATSSTNVSMPFYIR